jgi:large subunit ribosomal protein L2
VPLVKFKPTSPGRRQLVKFVNPDLHKGGPYQPLVEKQSKKAGRNVNGHITVRHQGGGHKQKTSPCSAMPTASAATSLRPRV